MIRVHRCLRQYVIAAALLGWLKLGLAQAVVEPPAAAASAVAQMQPVVIVGTRLSADRERAESTTAKQVVGSGEIARFGDTSLADVLRRVPGVTIVAGAGGQAEVRLRGLGAGYTQVLIDGDPAPRGFTIDTISPALIERIEILRVPTADQSAQAIAGTINIVLRHDDAAAQRSVKLTLGGPAPVARDALAATWARRDGALSWSAAATADHERSPSPTTLEQVATDPAGDVVLHRMTEQANVDVIDKLGLTSRLQWRLSDERSILVESWLSARRIDSYVDDTRTALQGPSALYPNDHQKASIRALLSRLTLAWHQGLADGGSADVKLGARYNRISGVSDFRGFDDTRPDLLLENIDALTVNRALTLKGEWKMALTGNHAVDMGWDGEHQQLDERRRQVQSAPAGYPAADDNAINRVCIARLALFAQDEWNVSKTLWAYGGLRWEGLRTRTTGNELAEVVGMRSGVFSPIAQLVWRPAGDSGDRLRLGLGRTYRSPTADQLDPRVHVANDNTPTTPNTRGNPALLPELAWGLDAAFEHNFPHDGGLLSVSGYVRSVRDIILQTLSQNNGVWSSMPVNAGDAKTAGVELELKAALQKLLPDAPNLDLRAHAGWNWSRLDAVPEPDNRLQSQTPFSASFGADYHVAGLPLTVGVGYAYTGGSRFRSAANVTGSTVPVRTLDAFASWTPKKGVDLRVSATNLLHQPQRSNAVYDQASGRFAQTTTVQTRPAFGCTLNFAL